MNSIFLALIALVGYLIAYNTYGKYLATKIFSLSSKNKMPSHEFEDGVDFVPTKKSIIFGHHFTTIAGLGPIVGPAIGVIWGWLPAFLWVVFGSIFMGAVHDFSTLIVSARNKGKTLGDLTGDLISPSTRYVFQFIMQLLLLIVLAVFAMIVGKLFVDYPESIFAVWMQIPIAIWLGRQVKKGKNDMIYSIIATVLMYISIYIGTFLPDFFAQYAPWFKMPSLFGSPVATWALILYVYVFIASTLPVDFLLQPRDYINSNQLLVAMALLVIGIIVAHPVISAPAINPAIYAEKSDIPSLMPLLFITIACGAISGFHSLASSGTTVKQVDNEKDTLFIGYGGMIWESFLAVIVIIAIAGGLGMGITDKEGNTILGEAAYQLKYSSWNSINNNGLGAKLDAFILGATNLISSVGIPKDLCKAMIAVFIVSFANTTLDSACRIQRISLQEIFKDKSGKVVKPIDNRFIATGIVVIIAMALTFFKGNANGALILWPLFGALNQLLAALALGVVVLYLATKGKNIWLAFIPMIFVLIMTVWAMAIKIKDFYIKKDILLLSISALISVLTVWLLVNSVSVMIKKKKV